MVSAAKHPGRLKRVLRSEILRFAQNDGFGRAVMLSKAKHLGMAKGVLESVKYCP